jgi:hypothetical protein
VHRTLPTFTTVPWRQDAKTLATEHSTYEKQERLWFAWGKTSGTNSVFSSQLKGSRTVERVQQIHDFVIFPFTLTLCFPHLDVLII